MKSPKESAGCSEKDKSKIVAVITSVDKGKVRRIAPGGDKTERSLLTAGDGAVVSDCLCTCIE